MVTKFHEKKLCWRTVNSGIDPWFFFKMIDDADDEKWHARDRRYSCLISYNLDHHQSLEIPISSATII